MYKNGLFLTLVLIGSAAFDVSAAVLVEDHFAGVAGTTPDSGRFAWSGEAALNGADQLGLQTWTVNQSWVRSQAGAAPAAGETLVLQMRAYA